jgi:predicted amidohydrolase
LLLVEPHGSALCDGAGFADAPALTDGDGLAEGAGVDAATALPEGMELAIASAAMGTSTMRFTVRLFSLGAARPLQRTRIGILTFSADTTRAFRSGKGTCARRARTCATMSRSIRVAAVQLRAHARADFASSVDATVASALAAAEHADLVVLPEGTFPAYVLESEDVDDAAIASALARLQDIAASKSCAIVAGAALRSGTKLRNAAVVIDTDGSIAGRAEKLFLWHFDRHWFEAGERIAPVRTSIGSIGAMICADGRIPWIARALVDRGADIIVMPTAWVTSGRDPALLENVQADLLARIRARENRVPFAGANKCGVELGAVAYCGKSQIVDAAGNVVAIASQHDPEIVRATVTIGASPISARANDEVTARAFSSVAPFRVAIALDAQALDIDRLRGFLDVDCVVAADDGITELDRAIPTVAISDERAYDPVALPVYRQAGYRAAVWSVSASSEWTVAFARARALELRMYIVVFDRSENRAYAIDPDGAIIAGTFGEYRLASFTLDPRRTMETTVAPGTDIAEGLARVGTIAGRKDPEPAV